MSDICKVVFSGELQQGFEPEKIIDAFSERFSVSREKAEKLIKSGQDVVLKGGLDQERAEKYKRTLEKLGMVVRIEGMKQEASRSALTLEPMKGEEDEKTLLIEAASRQEAGERCPRCGSTHMADGSCLDCGVVAEKFLAIQGRRQHEAGGDAWQAKPDNPYNAPEADLYERQDREMTGPKTVPIGHGLAWISGGWWYIKQNPLAWILTILALFGLQILAGIAGMIPLLGVLLVILFNLATPIFTAGLLLGCQAQDAGDDFSVGYLFAGFSKYAGQLMLVNLILLGAGLLFTLVMFAFLVMFGFGTVQGQNPELVTDGGMLGGFLMNVLMFILLFAPLVMAGFFAPALVALNDLKAMQAIKLSFYGCLKNLLPLIILGLLGTILLTLAAIPLGLGLLIVLPLLIASMYSAYRDIYYSR